MLDYLYYLFIAPLEWIMRTVLEAGFASFGTYGVALVFMSIVVNVMLLPLYHLAETWQESERRVQHDMEKQLRRIKHTFKGRERYMLISTLYRQHEYHPIFAVRTSFGFLIQVPFFFAAYHFLSHYAPLHGASFWIFSNLAKPDALLHVAGFDINVLPVLMTVINIFSALVYTNRLSMRDKVQLYVMAGLFLVLLYTAPSGLVFYWTCNNIFSLLKNMVYEELGIFSHGQGVIKKTRARLVLDNFGGFLEHAAGTRLQISILALGLASAIVRELLPSPAAEGTLVPVLLSAAVIVSCIWFVAVFFAWVLTGRLSLLLWAGYVCAVLFGAGSHAFFVLDLTAVILLFYQDCPFANKAQERACLLNQKEILSLGARALFLLAATLFVATPIRLFTADAGLFTSCTLALLTIAFALAIIAPYSLMRLARCNVRAVLCIAICTAGLAGFAYTWFLTRDYGPLDAFMFAWTQDMYHDWYRLADAAVLGFLLILATWCFIRHRALLEKLVSAAIFMTVILCGWNIYGGLSSKENAASAPAQEVQYPVHLSRTSPNVLVLMLDMFTGDHVTCLMKERPDVLSGFDGFTFYPDTISEADVTIMSLPSIIAGEKVAPRNLAKDTGKTLEESICTETESFFAQLKQKGLDARIAASDDIDFLAQKPYVSRTLYRRFMTEEDSAAKEQGGEYTGLFVVSYGLLQGMPWSLRQYVYNEGRWIMPLFSASKADVVGIMHSRRHYAVLNGLDRLTKADDGKGSYTFVTNELSHIPWYISKDTLKPVSEDPCPETTFVLDMRNGRIPEHYYAEAAAMQLLSQYFEWMKKEQVYDNTLIIVVSDHCEGDSQPIAAAFGKPDPAIAQGGTYPGRPGSLLMVKPAHASGSIRTDMTPMKSSDVRDIVEAFLDGRPFERKLSGTEPFVRYHATGEAVRRLHNDTSYSLQSLWKITGTRDERSHWEMLFSTRKQAF